AVSALGVWIAWKSSSEDKPTRIVEQRQAIPLTLRGTVQNDGRSLVIEPVEQSHALESLTLTFKGASPILLGSDGKLDASAIDSANALRIVPSAASAGLVAPITSRLRCTALSPSRT